MPAPRQRTPKVTVAWCPECLQYLAESYLGFACPTEGCPRKLVKRVGYICLQPNIVGDMSCFMFHRTVKTMKGCKHDAY